MLMDVKVRTWDRVTKREQHEIIAVDAASGDAAAEAGAALRPGCQVVGVTPKGGFGPVGGTGMEGEDSPPSPDDEDTEPPPSNRELALVARRTIAAVAAEQALPTDHSLIDEALKQRLADAGQTVLTVREHLADDGTIVRDSVQQTPKRGPGRPRKNPL